MLSFIKGAKEVTQIYLILFIFNGGKLLYNFVLISAAAQSESAIHMHIPPLPCISFLLLILAYTVSSSGPGDHGLATLLEPRSPWP